MFRGLAILAVAVGLVVPSTAQAISQTQAQRTMSKWIKSKPGPCGDGATVKCLDVPIMVCIRDSKGWGCEGTYRESVRVVSRRDCNGQGRIERGIVQWWHDDCHGV